MDGEGPLNASSLGTIFSIFYKHLLHAVDFPFLVELNSGSDIDVLVFRLIVRVLGI